MKYFYKFFLLYFILSSCQEADNSNTESLPSLLLNPLEVPLKKGEGYFINPATGDSIKPILNVYGDTIKTGVRMPVVFKNAYPSNPITPNYISFKKPEVVSYKNDLIPLSGNPVKIKVDTDRVKKIKFGEGDTSFILKNKNGIVKSGIPLPIKGRIVKAIEPIGKKALPLNYKPGATANLSKLDIENGLPHNYILSTVEDINGNLWFATAGGGACKYDGTRVFNYTSKEGLASDVLWGVYRDSKNNLWFTSFDRGICKYDGVNFIHFTENEGLTTNGYWGICEDSKNNLWLSSNKGASKLTLNDDGISGTITHIGPKEGLPVDPKDGSSAGSIPSIIEDKQGNIWFGTRDNGAMKFDGTFFYNFSKKEGILSNWVRRVLEDKDGNIWFVCAEGLNKYDGNYITQITTENGLPEKNIWGITTDKDGDLWFGTGSTGDAKGGSLTRFNGKNFKTYTETNGFTNSSVPTLYFDKSGNLWISTFGDGVFKLALNDFTHITENEGLPKSEQVSTIQSDSAGNFWFNQNEILIKFDGKDFTHFFSDLQFGRITASCLDFSGNYWFATNQGGIFCFKEKTLLNFSTKNGLYNNDVSTIFCDSKGYTWFAHRLDNNIEKGTTIEKNYEQVGLSRMHLSENNTVYIDYLANEKGLQFTQIPDLYEDKNGNIWIGTEDKGVCKYEYGQNENSGYLTYYTEKEGLSGNRVNTIVEDSKGAIWLRTNKDELGITKLIVDNNGEEKFLHFSWKRGFTDTYTWSLCTDKSGGIWVGSNLGITLIKEVTDSNQDSASKYQRFRFSYEDGLKGTDYYPVSMNYAKNQVIWRMNKGVTLLDLDHFRINKNVPKPWLYTVKFNGRQFDFDSISERNKKIKFEKIEAFGHYPVNPELPHNMNHLTFEFSATEWEAPHKLRFTYRLLGQDPGWSELTTDHYAEYRNLSSGTYIFELRAVGESNIWSDPLQYSFTIKSPLWLTWWAYTIYFIIAGLAVYSITNWRTRALRREKIILENKVADRTNDLKKSLEDLKATQSQLIHSEKMASLGELTAGIAHEIQNPLNFVNNFSEVNKEMLDELMVERLKPKEERDDKTQDDIINDLIANEEKIIHHGKRADVIVKGMLQHSRGSSGSKEPTDINALCDEYLRLAYHGLRAKDKSFTAKFEMELDESLPKINVVAQDIGRVILNLINNAFYVVHEKQKVVGLMPNAERYEPTVTVSTKKVNSKIEICVKDNGNGIPDSIKEKIFQPFFTTKPTGEGTGLGLSLSYDIIKAHGGELKVETKQGEGTSFIILLPL